MTANDLVILYEDNHILVVLKPQNVPCCEDSSKDPDLLSAVREYIKVTYNKQGNVYVGLVHRLDRPTGGVMVYAKSSKAAARLSEQLKNGDFEKKYFAVLVGSPREKKAVLTNYLKKNAVNNMVYVCGATVEGAGVLGGIIGKLALEKGVTEVVFDRGGHLYHGRIKAVAEGAREAGLKF
jgi:23S rRNA pseudouridine1911/1915/1917 synthase